MARENTARRKLDTSVLREAISAAVQAHGKGLILPKEMQIEKQADPKSVRSAPSFTTSTESVDVAQIPHAYTLPVLARFLGFVKAASQIPTNSFIAAFGAEELIADGVIKESQIKRLSAERNGRPERHSGRLPPICAFICYKPTYHRVGGTPQGSTCIHGTRNLWCILGQNIHRASYINLE
jgi:hypothetical protein